MDLAEPLVLVPGLLILGVGRAARFDDAGVMPWIVRLRHEKEIVFADPQQDIMLGRILAEARVAASELVETLKLEEIDAAPRPCLTLRTPRQNWGPDSDRLLGELEFDYGGALLPAGRTTPLAVSDRAEPGHPPRPGGGGGGRRPALRDGLPRGEGPPGRAGDDGAPAEADGAGDAGPGPGSAGGSRPRGS